jgi:hypothetical protein
MRNNVTAHYYQPKALHRGYRYFFFESGPEMKMALLSLGDSMKTSRFYFADGAAGGVHRSLDPDGTMSEQLTRYIWGLSEALYTVVAQYFVARAAALHREHSA